MRTITFTADDRRALAHDRYHHPDPRVQRKMEVLWLKSHGLGHDQIAAYADVSRRTVQRYLDQYLEGGLPRLRRCQWHKPQSALAEHQDSLEEYFLKHPVRSAKQARAIIEQQTGVRRGLTQVRHFLKDRLGLRWRRTGAIPVPPTKTVEEHAQEQTVFLQEKLEPRLEQAQIGQRQVYFVDAAHFVFAPFLGCVWCVARLFVRAASGRKRYNVLGALDAVTHRLIRVTNHGYTVVDPVLPSLWYDGCCSLGPRSHGEHRPLFLGGGTDRPCGLRLPFTRPGGPRRSLASRHESFHLHDRKPLRHQRGQLVPILAQMIQHRRHRRLHRIKRLVPAVQCLLPQELPQPFDQVEVRRIGRQRHQAELRMSRQPLLHHRLAVVLRIVQVQEELLRVGMFRPQFLQQLDELLASDVLLR